MNNELLKALKGDMYKYATEVNRLVEKYNRMKESGASISELNAIAIKAQDANTRYSNVKSEYEEYVYRYERFTYLEKNGGKKYDDARTEFYACQIHLLFKYGIEKGRIGLFALTIAIIVIVTLITKISKLSIPANIIIFLNNYYFIIIPIILTIILLLSYKISEKIFLKKEF